MLGVNILKDGMLSLLAKKFIFGVRVVSKYTLKKNEQMNTATFTCLCCVDGQLEVVQAMPYNTTGFVQHLVRSGWTAVLQRVL